MNKGFYFGLEDRGDIFGFSVAIVYDTSEKDFQIALTIGFLTMAIGWTF